MKRLLLTIAALMCAGMVSAQKGAVQPGEVRVPTEEEITMNILPLDSPYYYQKMMIRYMEGDTTLTDDHYYYLYYGHAYQPEYDAHRELPGASVIYDILKRASAPLSHEEAFAIIEAGKENMTVDPFSPWNVNMMTFAYGIVGDTLNVRINSDRFRGIVRAITSSGTGMREKSPWHILRFTHASDIIDYLGLTEVNRQVRSRDVEYVQVDRNSGGVRGYFFDFSRVYWRPFEGERVKKRSRWMFNGTPL